MIHFLSDSLRRGLGLLHEHRGFLYTVALFILIPSAFLWSGQQFLSVAREHHDRAEYSRIGLFHDVFVGYFKETGTNIQGGRHMAEKIAELNPDLRRFSLVRLEGEEFTQVVLAGEPVDLDAYHQAILAASVRTDESIVFTHVEDGERVRVGIRALSSVGVLPDSFLVTTFSLRAGDALYASRVRGTYVTLTAIILVLLVLVMRHARIINYAELYGNLKQALAAKTSFITMTAHELRSPLSAIRGYASMIRESKDLSEKNDEYARRIEESSIYMVALVSDMLDVAKLESGGTVLKNEPCSIQEVLSRVVTRLESLTKEHSVELKTEPISSELTILADQTRLEQILINLIGNALKYTKEGSVTLGATVVHGKCEIRIKDTGVGMSAEDQHKLFSPYFRTEDAESSKIIGTGLGMWITKQFIEKMGGTVDVESIHGVGTHVVVIFPLERV